MVDPADEGEGPEVGRVGRGAGVEELDEVQVRSLVEESFAGRSPGGLRTSRSGV